MTGIKVFSYVPKAHQTNLRGFVVTKGNDYTHQVKDDVLKILLDPRTTLERVNEILGNIEFENAVGGNFINKK